MQNASVWTKPKAWMCAKHFLIARNFYRPHSRLWECSQSGGQNKTNCLAIVRKSYCSVFPTDVQGVYSYYNISWQLHLFQDDYATYIDGRTIKGLKQKRAAFIHFFLFPTNKPNIPNIHCKTRMTIATCL